MIKVKIEKIANKQIEYPNAVRLIFDISSKSDLFSKPEKVAPKLPPKRLAVA